MINVSLQNIPYCTLSHQSYRQHTHYTRLLQSTKKGRPHWTMKTIMLNTQQKN